MIESLIYPSHENYINNLKKINVWKALYFSMETISI